MSIQFIILLCALAIAGGNCKNARVIGGRRADVEDHPFVAQIRMYINNEFLCAGAIISRRHILTTGHCVNDKVNNYSGVRVITGSSLLARGQNSVFFVSNIILHPNFQEDILGNNDRQNDIAIVQLNRNIMFNEVQRKIDLPTEDIAPGTEVTLFGWGVTSTDSSSYSIHLRKAKVQIMDSEICARLLPFHLQSDQFCTFSSSKGTGAGDSGGPIVHHYKLIGLISYSIPEANNLPNLQVNVFKHLDFIRRVLRPEQQNGHN